MGERAGHVSHDVKLIESDPGAMSFFLKLLAEEQERAWTKVYESMATSWPEDTGSMAAARSQHEMQAACAVSFAPIPPPNPRGIWGSCAERNVSARPMCAICGRPVDSLVEAEHFGRQRLIARCHGDVETIELPEGATVGDTTGVAFAGTRQLPP